MRKLVLALTIGGALSGCTQLAAVQTTFTTLAGLTVSPQQADIAASAFDGLEQTATQYLALPACTKANGPICRNPAAVPSIVADIRTGRAARNQLEQAVIANGAPPANLYNVLVTEINALQSLFTQYNIGSASK